MSTYLQTSTANPYGHRPWATRLYTTFDDFAFLKQPQNTILRGNQAMRPEIYKPPEMAGLGAVVVTGSGRVVGRMRRRGLGAIIQADPNELAFPYVPRVPSSQMIVRGPISTGPVLPGPMPVYMPPNPPTPIFPPSIVPPVPVPVASGPAGTVYALPGSPAPPGSPYTPPAPGELPAPGVPVSAGTTVAAPASTSALSDWFSAQTLISGIPNGYVAIGVAGALYFISKRGRR